MRVRPFAIVGVLAVLVLAWALRPGAASAAVVVVRITSTLEPPAITIAPGDTVTWRNDDGQRHRIRTTAGPGQFDSGDLDPGETFSISLSTEGTYAYRDERNKDNAAWWGSVVVTTSPPPGGGPTPVPGASPTPTPPPAPAQAQVGMAGRAFTPRAVTIAVGGQVTWRNDDTRDHTVTATGVFDSGIMAAGAAWTRTFASPGTYAYLCLIHPDMTGTVTVTGPIPTPVPGASPTPVPTPAPTPVPGAADVLAVDLAFQPATFTVDAGTTITFANRGQAAHTVTARDGTFASPLLAPGATWRQAFATPGTYAYLCTLHPEMAGTIVVRGAGGNVPPPPSPSPSPSPVPDRVAMLDFSFGPPSLSVPAGTTVTWSNDGVAPHTATQAGGGFNSGFIQPGGRWSWTFSTPGTFAYICAIHPQMTGEIRVTAAAASSPNAAGSAGVDGAGAAGSTAPGAGGLVGGAAGAGGGSAPGVAQPGSGDGASSTSPAAAAGAATSRSPLWGVLAGVLIAGALLGGLRVVQDVGRRADLPADA